MIILSSPRPYLPPGEGEMWCESCHLLVMAASAVWNFSDKTEIVGTNTCISSPTCQPPQARDLDREKNKKYTSRNITFYYFFDFKSNRCLDAPTIGAYLSSPTLPQPLLVSNLVL